MPERAKSLASVFVAGTLAAALFGLDARAGAAAECLENPDLRTAQPGHWYYHFDRLQNRRCWHFEPAEATSDTTATTTAAAPPAAPETAAVDDPQQSVFSRFAAGLSQAFSPPQPPPPQQLQQAVVADTTPSETSPAVSLKPQRKRKDPSRVAPRERPPAEAAPVTDGVATGRHDPTQQATTDKAHPAAEKNEKRDSPLDVADREALFQDFMKWQMERNVFGRP